MLNFKLSGDSQKSKCFNRFTQRQHLKPVSTWVNNTSLPCLYTILIFHLQIIRQS